MARMPRLVIPGYPHHVIQRGNRRQRTFFSRADYFAYIDLIARAKTKADAEIWAYCLMPNHVHFVVVPAEKDSLARLFQEAHRRYTRRVNAAHEWRGHLWQERFQSFLMDEHHLMAAVRYVEHNPVTARLCKRPQDWQWSSAGAHLAGVDDALVTVRPMLDRVGSWVAYLDEPESPCMIEALRRHTRSGRPAGDEVFIERLEGMTGRELKRRRRGPPASSR